VIFAFGKINTLVKIFVARVVLAARYLLAILKI
jgi:hypothetical protein